MKSKLFVLAIVVGLFAAACGDSDTEGDADTGGGDGGPVIAGLCAEDEPDCDDVGVIDGSDQPDASDDGGSLSSSGMVVDGGLTVSQALESELTEVLAVQGFLLADGTSVRLCEALMESFPPQCGSPNLTLAGFTADQLDTLPDDENITIQTNQGISWTDQAITLFGRMVDGELVVDTLTTG